MIEAQSTHFEKTPAQHCANSAVGPSYLLFLPGIIKFFTVLGLVLGASRYAFKVAALASRGVLHSRDYTNALTDPDWKVLPWKFLACWWCTACSSVFWAGRARCWALSPA